MPTYLVVLRKTSLLGLPRSFVPWLFEKDGFPERRLTTP